MFNIKCQKYNILHWLSYRVSGIVIGIKLGISVIGLCLCNSEPNAPAVSANLPLEVTVVNTGKH